MKKREKGVTAEAIKYRSELGNELDERDNKKKTLYRVALSFLNHRVVGAGFGQSAAGDMTLRFATVHGRARSQTASLCGPRIIHLRRRNCH
jgi:hypothetical protein